MSLKHEPASQSIGAFWRCCPATRRQWRRQRDASQSPVTASPSLLADTQVYEPHRLLTLTLTLSLTGAARAVTVKRAALGGHLPTSYPANSGALVVRVGSASPLPAGAVAGCGARAHGGHGHAHFPAARHLDDEETHKQVRPPEM